MAQSKKAAKPAAKSKKSGKSNAPEEKIESALGKTEKFLQDYSKQLLTALIVVLVLVGGYFGYVHLIAQPRAEKAAENMFVAEQLFAQGDFETALNGDGNNPGFLEITDNYGGTRPGRLAAHYAGICYLKLGDADSALDYLAKYKPAKGSTAAVINAQNFGLRGDVYAQRGDLNKALDLYKKAVDAGNNILTTPYFLKKSAEIYTRQGNHEKALEACYKIKNQYGGSIEARDIDKYIGALEQL